MSDLFRPEALEHHAAKAAGDVLRVAPRWTAWLFWLLLVSVVAGVAAAWFVRIDGDRLFSVLVGGG